MNIVDTFFNILRKCVVAMVFVIFGFTFTYVPQPYNHINTVEAGAAAGGATEITQILNNIQLGAVNVASTATSVASAAISFATGNLWIKENILDGIAWTLAKGIISTMVSSMVDWINSGFEGNPAFLQDLQSHLLRAADEAFTEFSQFLGSAESFLCDPDGFDLKTQVRIILEEEFIQEDILDQPIAECEIEDYADYAAFTEGDFLAGGWDDWLDLVSKPSDTPYGQLIGASQAVDIALAKREDTERTYLDFGDGFLSGQICNFFDAPGGPVEDCIIAKPGKILQEALTVNLDSGRQSLVAADEFNEILAALLTELSNQAITGANGLLGLSGNTGYSEPTATGGTYTGDLTTNPTPDGSPNVNNQIAASLSTQESASDVATQYEATFQALINNPATEPIVVAQLESELANIANFRDRADVNTTALGELDITATDLETQQAVAQQYNALQSNLISQTELNSRISYWDSLIGSADQAATLSDIEDDCDPSLPPGVRSIGCDEDGEVQ